MNPDAVLLVHRQDGLSEQNVDLAVSPPALEGIRPLYDVVETLAQWAVAEGEVLLENLRLDEDRDAVFSPEKLPNRFLLLAGDAPAQTTHPEEGYRVGDEDIVEQIHPDSSRPL